MGGGPVGRRDGSETAGTSEHGGRREARRSYIFVIMCITSEWKHVPCSSTPQQRPPSVTMLATQVPKRISAPSAMRRNRKARRMPMRRSVPR